MCICLSEVMFHKRRHEEMKAPGFYSGGFSCWHMFPSSIRPKTPGSRVQFLPWLLIHLLVILLPGQASCNHTSAAPSSPPTTTTAAQASEYYFIDVTVDVTGQKKDESEIIAWLKQIFQTQLEKCAQPTSPQTSTPTSNSTETTTTTVQIYNITTAATTVDTTTQNYTTELSAVNSTTPDNTTTTAVTMVPTPNNTTTAVPTVPTPNNTTTAVPTVPTPNNKTTAVPTVPTPNNKTTAVTTVPTTPNNTTTAVTTVPTTPNNTTTAVTTVPTTLNNKTTAVPMVPTPNNKTTAVTTVPTTPNNTTTADTVPTANYTTATATSTATTSTEGTTNTSTTPATTQNSSSTTSSAISTRERISVAVNLPFWATKSYQRVKRVVRQISGNMTDSSGTTNDTTMGVYKEMEVSCAIKTGIKNTKCAVTLQLSQRVHPCCILHTLCAASKNSSDIHVVGQKIDRLNQLHSNECSSDPGEKNSCIYTGPTSPTCNNSAAAYEVPPSNLSTCPATNRTCSCSAYCNRSDAYYTFEILVQDPMMNFSYVSSLISKLKQPPPCNTTTNASCPLSIIAVEYKDANLTCGSTTNLQSCMVVLGFSREVPICSVAAAVMKVFRSETQISFNGKVIRAAICETSGVSDNPLQPQATWLFMNLKPATFCSIIQASNILGCQNGKNVVVQLEEDCVATGVFTTASPNMTTMQTNDTALPVNATSSPLNTTTAQLNTTAAPNTTTTSNNTTTAINTNTTTTTSNNTTTSINTNTTTAINTNTTTTTSNNTTTSINTNTTTTTSNNTTTSINTNTTTTNSNNTNTTNNTNITATSTTTSTTANITTTTPKTTTTTNETIIVPTTAGTDEGQANALLELSKNVSNLNASQVNQLVSQLEKLLSGPTVSLALGNTSVNIVSQLLGASPQTLSQSSNRIIGIVDTVGLKLVMGEKAQSLLSPAVALSVKPADGANFQQTFFSISDPTNVQVRGDPRLTRSVTKDSSTPQGSISLPSSLTQNLTTEEQQQVSRVQFNFYQKSTVFQDRSIGKRKLNSGILGASVANLSIKGLKDDIIIHLRNTEPVPANFVATCVFWDFTLNEGSGGWNSNGCNVQKSTDNETVCGCNHLTSFAILLDLARQPITSRLQATILTFITYIGCGLSAIFLSVTLLTYLAFGKLRKDIPSKILIQLCLSLLLLNLVFLVDAWLALYPGALGLCISTAWFLHYFLLVSFTWMGLGAVHMYLALVKVFNSYISHYMLRFSVVGWGVPMIVVIIVIAVDKNNYGLVSYGKFSDGTSDEFCWLKNDIAFYVAVVAYFCVIFLFNLAMFIVVLVQLYRIKKQNPQNTQHRTTLQDVRSVVGITILLGLTWGFAFFAWGPVNLPFMYLFAIFNSLQGFFIFVFHCAVKENVRRQWRTYLCCGSMRLAENSEWSRTATQKTVRKLSLTKLTSLQSSNSSRGNNSSSSSSFLVSDSSEQINGIGSPFDDAAIIGNEDQSMDVVLNEINRQHRHSHSS
ncbi:mucin-5AC [Parambassis ranga]|uniref:Adhesion G-protein coupled receptor G2 n=1 Tax=Parambassis ranga TaxID=210632 RepID=A0A6P7JK85_9TELE|nr:mucin-5AC-like [Parambassis ranga]